MIKFKIKKGTKSFVIHNGRLAKCPDSVYKEHFKNIINFDIPDPQDGPMDYALAVKMAGSADDLTILDSNYPDPDLGEDN